MSTPRGEGVTQKQTAADRQRAGQPNANIRIKNMIFIFLLDRRQRGVAGKNWLVNWLVTQFSEKRF